MKKKYFLLITLFFSLALISQGFAQGTETFEAPLPVNSTTWTNAGLTFTSSSANFDTDEFVNAGAGGSDRYIDNIDAPGLNSTYSIDITGGATLFTMQSMEVYVSSSATGSNPTDDGTMTFRGLDGGVEVFTYTKPMGTFPTTFGATNGFFLLDFSALPGVGDVSNMNIDELEISINGAFQYFAVDNFEFDNEVLNTDPPEVQSIVVVGTPNSTATSVDFLVTFNENANLVSIDDFSVDATGGVTGSITGISGSGTAYTLTITGISGEGTISIDLNAGTNIEDDLGNSPPPAFTAGEIHVVSRCFQETFETFTAGDIMWSSNGVTYTSTTANFDVELFTNGGAGGSDQFLSNDADQGTGKIYSITTTGPELFNVEALDIYLSSELNGANPTDDGTLTLEGRHSGSTLFTIQKTMGFPTSFAVNNGFYVVDFATEGASDYSLTNIDELRITIGGAFQYVALDNFEHCEEVTAAAPPIVQSIKLVGNPPANSASVDFEVIFNEDAVNVTADDFSLDFQGSAAGTINGVSGSGNTYMVDVNAISGEGSLRVDLNAGTDIEDTSGNTPPDPFTDGERFIVSICDVETYETLAIGTFNWTTNSVPWTSGSVDFGVDEFIGAGAGGSDRYVDNVTSQSTGDVNSISITDTQMVKMGSMEIYVSSILNGTNPTDDGTLTVVGKLDGVDQYTVVKSTGFPTIFGSTQGFYLWDFSTEGGVDHSMTDIDEIELTLGGAFQYLAVDNFKFCMDPPDETDVTLAAGALSITDINGGVSDDNINLSINGANLRITNTVDRFQISGAGVVEVDDNTVDVLLANITNGIVLNTMAGTDSYTQGTAISLAGATNDFTVLNIESFTQSAALDVGGSIVYGVTGSVALNNTTAGGDLDVTAVGDITDSGTGIIVGGTTMLDAASGIININEAAGNAFTGNVTLDAGQIIDFVSNAPLQFGVISATNAGNVTSTITNNGGPITFNGNVMTAIPSDLAVRAPGGVSQSPGTAIVTDNLTLEAFTSDVSLVNPGLNDINSLVVTSGGNIAFNDIDDIDVQNTLSNTLTVSSGGTMLSTGTKNINGGGISSLTSGADLNCSGTINQNMGTLNFMSPSNIVLGHTHTSQAGTTTNINGGAGTVATAGTSLTFFDLFVNAGAYQTNGNVTNVNGVATIAATADLIGTGSINGEVSILSGGELAPGNSPGCLSTGNITLASGSTASFEVTGATPCTQHDQIQVTGTVTINGANFNPLIGYANGPTDEIILILNDGVDAVTGTFAGLPQGTAVNFGAFSGFISYVGGDGNDVILTADNTPPVVTCPADITQANDPGVCSAVVTFTVTATDDNPGVTLVVTPPSGSTFPVGTTLVTATATDAAGNTATCTFNVTVNDTENPVVSCPADIVVNNDPGVCGAIVNFAPTATDNCPGTVVTSVPASGSVFPVGTTTVNVSATDAAGNTATCSFDVTVNDNENPVVSCPADIVVNNDPGVCGATVNFAPTATDNCPGTVITSVPASGSVFPIGTTTVNVTATDASGNTATCSFDVTVNDTEAPTITCPADTTVSNDPGVCGATVTYAVTSSDNCPGETVVQTAGLPSGSVFPVGTTTNTFVVTDASGNTATCSFDVTVNDTENPTITCPADIIVSNDPGVCGATVTYVVTSSDNCPGETIAQTAGLPSGNVFPVGTTTNTFVVTDASGNTATCSFDVTVNDTEAPTITCPADIAVNNDPGVCGAAVTYTVTSSDNCPGETIAQTAGLPSGSVFPVGTTTNTFVVTDASGNTATCSFDVIVTDNEPPVANCVAPFTIQLDANGMASITPADINNGSTDNCGIASLAVSPSTFTCADVGAPVTVTLTVTDVNGNSSTCTTDVTVEDNVDPVIICSMDITANSDPGVCGADISFAPPIAIDACGIASVVQTMGLPSGSVFPVGVSTIEFTATDNNGNMSTCSFTITITDVEPATITCPADITQTNDPGICGAVVTFADPVVMDNCPVPPATIAGFTTLGSANGKTYYLSDAALGGIASFNDAVANGGFAVTVESAAENTFLRDAVTAAGEPGPFRIGYSDNASEGTFVWHSGSSSAYTNWLPGQPDNAPVNADFVTIGAGGPARWRDTRNIFQFRYVMEIAGSLVQTAGLPSGSEFPVGTTTNTFEYTDIGGNTVSCSFDVTITDDEAPVIVCEGEPVPSTDSISDTPGLPIDTDPGNVVVTSVINIAADETITDMDVDLDISHTWVGDLIITLESPAGTVVSLFNGPTLDCGEVDILATLDDAAATLMDDECNPGQVPTIDGTFRPTSPLAAFNGESTLGNWTLTVTDNFPGLDSGTLNEWGMTYGFLDVATPLDVILDVNGMATVNAIDLLALATDNCGTVTATVNGQPTVDFTCADVGENMVEVVVEDGAGNSSTCIATVNVIDNIAPMLVCMDFTLELGDDGTAVLDPFDLIDPSSFDACGIVIAAVDIEDFDCSDIGTPVLVTLFVNDPSMNPATCQAIVTVVDLLGPEIVCPLDQTQDPGPGNLFYTVPDYWATGEATATDNCTDPVVITSQDPAPGTLLPDGVYTVTITAEDEYGNVSTCDFELTVESILGIGESSLDIGSIVMYPNPATNVVYLSNPQSLELESVSIYDAIGRLIKVIDLRNAGVETALDISELASATYLVHIKGAQGEITKQLIKE